MSRNLKFEWKMQWVKKMSNLLAIQIHAKVPFIQLFIVLYILIGNFFKLVYRISFRYCSENCRRVSASARNAKKKETANALPNGPSLSTKVWYSFLFSGCLFFWKDKKQELVINFDLDRIFAWNFQEFMWKYTIFQIFISFPCESCSTKKLRRASHHRKLHFFMEQSRKTAK